MTTEFTVLAGGFPGPLRLEVERRYRVTWARSAEPFVFLYPARDGFVFLTAGDGGMEAGFATSVNLPPHEVSVPRLFTRVRV